jgi:hypothetical protein
MPLALPALTVRRKRHESVMNSVSGVRNGSAASGQRESQAGRSHARSTSQSTLVAHPVGRSEMWEISANGGNQPLTVSSYGFGGGRRVLTGVNSPLIFRPSHARALPEAFLSVPKEERLHRRALSQLSHRTFAQVIGWRARKEDQSRWVVLRIYRGCVTSRFRWGFTDALHADPEGDELVTVARRLQASQELQVDPQFARLLEARLLQRHASLHKTRAKRRWFIPQLLGPRPAFAMAIGLCLLILLLGTGVLVVAAQVSNPENPLDAVKNWEQQMPVSMASSPQSRVALDVQFAREKLGMQAELAGPAHAQAYRQALADFDQQVSVATGAIRDLTSKADRTCYWANWRGSKVMRATHGGGFCLNFPWRNGC